MPEGAENEHAQSFATRQPIEGDSTQPDLSLNVPVVEYALDARRQLTIPQNIY